VPIATTSTAAKIPIKIFLNMFCLLNSILVLKLLVGSLEPILAIQCKESLNFQTRMCEACDIKLLPNLHAFFS
jgi:hypothetical protein